jgi:PAP2 superfamily
MYQFILLVAVQGSVVLPGQPGPVITQDDSPVHLGAPIFAPAPVPLPTRRVANKPDVILTWNSVLLEIIKAEKTPPPLASRNLAILHAAMYDTVNAITPTHSPYRVQEEAPAGASPECAASIAAHRVLLTLYPQQADRLDEALDHCLETVPEGPARSGSLALGQSVAEKMLALRSNDGAARKTSYPSGTYVGQWRPTPPDYRSALLPQWPRLTCFCMRSSDQFRPASPPELTSSAYARSLNEVRLLGATLSTVRTRDQTDIAWFWADGEGTVTPPGHWNRIAQTVARSRGNSLQENARLFALLNLAMADAAVLCWDCKYHYGFWRPVTAIRYADRDGNPDTDADPDWTPLLPTPPFPSYTSGHSSFSAAGAAVLAHFFGTDEVAFASRSDSLPGVTRSFAGFSAAAREAGMSRIYGGIHYDFDNEVGLSTGRALGDYVYSHFLLPLARTDRGPVTPDFAVRRR